MSTRLNFYKKSNVWEADSIFTFHLFAQDQSLMDIFKIQPDHFFKTENEKIRMNWFLFELAVELATEISNSPISKKLKKNGYTVSDINLACITFVKSLKVFILDFLNKKIPQMVIDY